MHMHVMNLIVTILSADTLSPIAVDYLFTAWSVTEDTCGD